MTETPIDIERLVQEVLRELRVRCDGPSSVVPTADAGRSQNTISPQRTRRDAEEEKSNSNPLRSSASSAVIPAISPTSPSNNGQLVLTGRVVTMTLLDGRLEGIRRVVVPARAVVTPAVHDELQRRRVALAYAAAAPGAAARPVLLTLLTMGTPLDPAPLIAALGGLPVEVRPEGLDCLIAATERLAGAVTGGAGLGLLLTPHTAAAMCLANRHAGVRAVLAGEVAATAAAAAGIGANLLVADPAVLGWGALKRIVLDYCRGGVRPCPKVFWKQLA
jgi:hypothetical protein